MFPCQISGDREKIKYRQKVAPEKSEMISARLGSAHAGTRVRGRR